MLPRMWNKRYLAGGSENMPGHVQVEGPFPGALHQDPQGETGRESEWLRA